MGIAHTIILLVTLLFVLTTRGVTLDIQSAGRLGVPTETPATSPVMNRISSAPLLQREMHMERQLNLLPEHSKRNGRWERINASGESIQSAPASPAAGSRSWHSSHLSALNHYHNFSDTDISDNEYGNLTRDVEEGSSLEDHGGADENVAEIADYPTPSSKVEVNK